MLFSYRIDILHDTVEEQLQELIKDTPKGFYIKEQAKKTNKIHIHGIGEYPELLTEQGGKTKEMKKAFQDILGEKYRKGTCSFAVTKDEERYIQYILKGVTSKAEIYSVKGYSTDYLEKFIQNYRKPTVCIGQSLLDFVSLKKDYFLQHNVVDEKRLFLLVTSFFGENTKKFRHFLILEYFNMVKYQYVRRGLITDMYNEALMSGVRFYRRDTQTGQILYNPDMPEYDLEDHLDELEKCIGHPKKISLEDI